MRILFLMDPMSGLHFDKDTTFGLMLAAKQRGHELDHALPLALSARDGELFVDAAQTTVDSAAPHFSHSPRRSVNVADYDAVFIRNDPPFNANYAYMTQLLELVRGRTLVINDPRGLREANEKLYALHFPEWTPKTIVTASQHQIRAFVNEVGGKAVIKPLDGMGGLGIFLLHADDRNFGAIVEATIGEYGNTYCMVQEYLPAAREGDKRILLLEGNIMGAILRVPKETEARANIHAGGSVVQGVITERERQLVASIAPKLVADGLYFVGLDVIGERLTEVNVTSPTGIRQMAHFDQVDHSGNMIAWLEAKLHDRPQ